MGYLAWTAATGVLLLLMSLSYGWISRAPVPIFGIYLIVGMLCGPWVFNILHLDILRHSVIISRITDITMAVSLFIAGLKIRHPVYSDIWKMGIRLAVPAMLLTIAALMVLSHFLAGLSWPLSLAFAAIIAPTDPVLASLIAMNDARDDNQLRLSLSCEAGLNDGTALPFLLLALLWHNAQGAVPAVVLWKWFSVDLLWALFAGLAVGYLLGKVIGLAATRSRHMQQEVAPSDFVALALICLSFALALSLNASGFLAAFAAGIGLRSAEMNVQKNHPSPDNAQPDMPAEMQVNPHTRHAIDNKSPVKLVGLVIGDALSFGDTVERLLAAGLVMILGVTLAQHWNVLAILIALILFVVIRPTAVYLATWRSGRSVQQRFSMGWLGIRGIGSLNYIAYAYSHGLQGEGADHMIDIAITVVTLSVLVHGVTVTPLLKLRRSK
jgi:NhaP-type Na+/H+ or K+/H+ antiporter